MACQVRLAQQTDAPQVVALVDELLREIMQRSEMPAFALDSHQSRQQLTRWLAEGSYTVLLAEEADQAVGCLTMEHGRALYAQGRCATVREFYVAPHRRSQGVGKQLMERAIRRAASQGLRRLELTTPPIPAFERSVGFYQKHGFEITGGYKMKRIIEPWP
uniref:Putative GCN5-related N-acetyltransferase n=1 Tax=Magnetococcus massalia (strain MO-1) TaxID=451514 RepID=A0A1S7LF29_MAGMO|nr:putative GCN5-related N-acetyltransferase [Candidatus Magnetococcus massalia]